MKVWITDVKNADLNYRKTFQIELSDDSRINISDYIIRVVRHSDGFSLITLNDVSIGRIEDPEECTIIPMLKKLFLALKLGNPVEEVKL